MFRSLLVDNGLRYLFNPLLGALGGLVGWALFTFALSIEALADTLAAWETVAYFCAIGLGVAFGCNLLASIQDGASAGRVFTSGLVAAFIGGAGGLLGGLIFHLAATLMGLSPEDLMPRLLCYLFVGTIVGLTSRLTTIDKLTGLAAVGGLLGGLLAVGIWMVLEKAVPEMAAYSSLLISMSLGLGIGATTYSLPSWVSGGTLIVLTGQFKKQRKSIENDDILIGNNKRQLQWVLPKWEGIQDPHAKLEVHEEGKGYKHAIRNMSTKTVIVVRERKKNRVKSKQAMELEDGDVLVFATGKSYVKVRYRQKQDKD